MSRPTLSAFGVTALLLTTAQPATAQQSDLTPGDRVRVTLTDAAARSFGARRWEATFVGETADSVVIRQPDRAEPLAISRTDLEQFERFAGRKSNAGKGAAIGAGVGALVGIGALVFAAADGGDELGYGTGMVMGASLVTVPLGALVGTAIGAASHSDRWKAVVPDLKVAPTVVQGVPGIALSIRF